MMLSISILVAVFLGTRKVDQPKTTYLFKELYIYIYLYLYLYLYIETIIRNPKKVGLLLTAVTCPATGALYG